MLFTSNYGILPFRLMNKLCRSHRECVLPFLLLALSESSNVKSFNLCFKYLTKKQNAFLLGFHFREMQEKQ